MISGIAGCKSPMSKFGAGKSAVPPLRGEQNEYVSESPSLSLALASKKKSNPVQIAAGGIALNAGELFTKSSSTPEGI